MSESSEAERATGRARESAKTGRVRRDWRIPDAMWQQSEPLLPPRKAHPLGCHRPRVPDRAAMDALFVVLRTGCQWDALNAPTLGRVRLHGGHPGAGRGGESPRGGSGLQGTPLGSRRVNAVVERTHRWMNRFRGLLVRRAKKPGNYLAQLHLACACIAFRQADLMR